MHRLFIYEQEQYAIEEIEDEAGLTTILNHEAKDSLDKMVVLDIRATPEDYNIAVTPHISANILARLPRELRDIIYEFLAPKQITVCVEDWPGCPETPHVHRDRKACDTVWYKKKSFFNSLQSEPCYHTILPRTEWDRICPHHFWRGEAICQQMATELMEAFFRTTIFQIDADSLRGIIPDRVFPVISKHRFNMLSRTSSRISDLKFVLMIRVYDGNGLTKKDRAHQLKAVTNWLKVLGCLKKKCRIGIQLDILKNGRDTTDMSYVNHVMGVVLKGLMKLHKAGYRLRFGYTAEMPRKMMDMVLGQWLDYLEREHGKAGK